MPRTPQLRSRVMRRLASVVVTLGTLAACSSEPSMSDADAAICQEQDSVLQGVRAVLDGTATADETSAAASTALDRVGGWADDVDDPKLQIIVADVAVSLSDIAQRAGVGLRQADLSLAESHLDDLSGYCTT